MLILMNIFTCLFCDIFHTNFNNIGILFDVLYYSIVIGCNYFTGLKKVCCLEVVE